MSTIQTENVWPRMQAWGAFSVEASASTQSEAFNTVRHLHSHQGTITFRGRLEIPGTILTIPEQEFLASRRGDELFIENQPTDHWPLISLRFYTDPFSKTSELKNLLVTSSDNTVVAGILLTRVTFSLLRVGRLRLQSNQIGGQEEYVYQKPPKLDEASLYAQIKIFRKLKYIEKVFRTEFSMPEEISWQDALNIEILFRGITEGEFAIRGGDITFLNVSLSKIDLTKPPFEGIGAFSLALGPEFNVLGKRFDVGPVKVHLAKAELADPKVMNHIRKEGAESVDIRLALLDNLIGYRFETYARLSPKQRLQKLNRFKQELAHEESEELINLIDQSLQNQVSLGEAHQIAMGWILYNDLPDRYYPQEPQLDSDAQCWHVPIYLVYADGEGGPVGELVIDVKTGKIIKETPVEELRRKGLALAEQILHA